MKAKWINALMLVVVFGLGSCLNNGEDPNAGWYAEVKQIDDYLAANPPLPTDYVLRDDYSGIRFVIHEFGQDRIPKLGQSIKLNYEGRLLSTGALFDADLFQDKIDNISVAGLQYAVGSVLMGTNATIYVPSRHGYGDAGNSVVPGKSILVYDFVLEDIVRTASQSQQFMTDTAAIHNYIKDPANSIVDAIEHPSGLWYKIEQTGSGDFPVVYDVISFDYKMFLLNGTTPVDEGTLNGTSLFDLIDALQAGISLVDVGGKIIYYIPSELGYGTKGFGSIPANANLRFEMTLKSIDTP